MLKPYYFAVVKTLLLVAVLTLLGALVAGHHVRPFQLPTLASHHCPIADARGERGVFHVYVPTSWRAEEYVRRLCDEVLRESGFSHARISWLPREYLSSEDIVTKEYKLIWSRHNSLKGLMQDYERFYDVLLAMPNYTVYWLSHNDSPTLSQAFFNGKRIGFLEDSKSQSAYQQPMRQLRENNIQLTEHQITFYPSRQNLIKDFLEQKLDLVSVTGVGDYGHINHWPAQKKILISDQMPIGNWYIDNIISTPTRCRILKSLSLYTTMIEQAASVSITPRPCP